MGIFFYIECLMAFGLSPFDGLDVFWHYRRAELMNLWKPHFSKKALLFWWMIFVTFLLLFRAEDWEMRSWWWRKWFFTFNASLLCWEDKIRRTFLMNCYVCGQSGARHWDFFFFFQPNQNCHLIWHKDRLQRTLQSRKLEFDGFSHGLQIFLANT